MPTMPASRRLTDSSLSRTQSRMISARRQWRRKTSWTTATNFAHVFSACAMSLPDQEASHLGGIPYKQFTMFKRGMVPCFALYGRNPEHFLVRIGAGFNESEVAIAAEDDEVAAREQELAVTVAAVLPFAFADVGVEAGEHVFVEAIDVAMPEDGAGELVLEVLVAPKLARAGGGDLDGGAASAVAGGKEEAIAAEQKGLGDVAVTLQHDPRKFPEQLAIGDGQSHGASLANDQQLALANEGCKHGRAVGGRFFSEGPDRDAVRFFVGDHVMADDDQLIVDDQWGSGDAVGEVRSAFVC